MAHRLLLERVLERVSTVEAGAPHIVHPLLQDCLLQYISQLVLAGRILDVLASSQNWRALTRKPCRPQRN